MKGMNSLDFWERLTGIIIAFIAGLSGPVILLLNKRQRAADASKIEAETGVGISNARKIDAEVLQTVRGVYRAMIDDLEARMDKMEKELTDVTAEKDRLKVRVDELEQDGKKKDRQIEKLERHITTLESQLKQKEDKA